MTMRCIELKSHKYLNVPLLSIFIHAYSYFKKNRKQAILYIVFVETKIIFIEMVRSKISHDPIFQMPLLKLFKIKEKKNM